MPFAPHSAPVVSYLGLAAANVLTGSVVVETIFGVPGMGRYFVDGALGRDYTLVMGTVVVVAAAVLSSISRRSHPTLGSIRECGRARPQ